MEGGGVCRKIKQGETENRKNGTRVQSKIASKKVTEAVKVRRKRR